MAEDQIQEIKNKIDIVGFISGYVPLKKAGKNYKALCGAGCGSDIYRLRDFG